MPWPTHFHPNASISSAALAPVIASTTGHEGSCTPPLTGGSAVPLPPFNQVVMLAIHPTGAAAYIGLPTNAVLILRNGSKTMRPRAIKSAP